MADRLRLLRWSDHNRASWRTLVERMHTVLDGFLPDASGEPEEPSEIERAREILRLHRARVRLFSPLRTIFHNPAWDVMLQLFIAHEEGRAMTVDDLHTTSIVPAEVLKRWVRALEGEGIIARWPNVTASRGDVIALTPYAMETMLRFLDDV